MAFAGFILAFIVFTRWVVHHAGTGTSIEIIKYATTISTVQLWLVLDVSICFILQASFLTHIMYVV